MDTKKIIIFHNSDKGFHEKPHETNLGCLTHPFTLICPGSMNSGKTNAILNILYQRVESGRTFDKIYLWHFDEDSTEYDCIDHEKIDSIPELSKINKNIKNLLIIEDLDIKSLNPYEISKIDRCMGYISTHCNMSVIITTQQGFAIPVRLRRLNTHLMIWNKSDPTYLATVEPKINCEKGELKKLLIKYCKGNHDFLLFAFKEKPIIRFNLFEGIEF